MRIWQEKEQEKYFLRLEAGHKGSVIVVIVDEDGDKVEAGNVVSIYKDCVYRHWAINSKAAKALELELQHGRMIDADK